MTSLLLLTVRRLAGRALFLTALAAMVSCRSTPPLLPGETLRKAIAVDQRTLQPLDGSNTTPSGPPAVDHLYEWTGSHLPGPISITVDLSEQKAWFQRGGKPAGWTYVATGRSGYSTRSGNFSVSEKVKDKRSTLWGQTVDRNGDVISSSARAGSGRGRFIGAPMPYWMRFNGAVGLHAGPIPSPGDPASHGCVRLPRGIAEILFDVVKIGTPVRVVP